MKIYPQPKNYPRLNYQLLRRLMGQEPVDLPEGEKFEIPENCATGVVTIQWAMTALGSQELVISEHLRGDPLGVPKMTFWLQAEKQLARPTAMFGRSKEILDTPESRNYIYIQAHQWLTDQVNVDRMDSVLNQLSALRSYPSVEGRRDDQ